MNKCCVADPWTYDSTGHCKPFPLFVDRTPAPTKEKPFPQREYISLKMTSHTEAYHSSSSSLVSPTAGEQLKAAQLAMHAGRYNERRAVKLGAITAYPTYDRGLMLQHNKLNTALGQQLSYPDVQQPRPKDYGEHQEFGWLHKRLHGEFSCPFCAMNA